MASEPYGPGGALFPGDGFKWEGQVARLDVQDSRVQVPALRQP